MSFTACYAPHAAAHEPTSIVKRCTLDLKKIISVCIALQEKHPLFTTDYFFAFTTCTDTTKTFPLVFPAWFWKKKHVRALMVQYAIPNAGTGRQSDEQLKLWIHGQGSSNVLSPILIHFIHWVILKKLPFHVHDLMLQNKRNGFQLYWKR